MRILCVVSLLVLSGCAAMNAGMVISDLRSAGCELSEFDIDLRGDRIKVKCLDFNKALYEEEFRRKL